MLDFTVEAAETCQDFISRQNYNDCKIKFFQFLSDNSILYRLSKIKRNMIDFDHSYANISTKSIA